MTGGWFGWGGEARRRVEAIERELEELRGSVSKVAGETQDLAELRDRLLQLQSGTAQEISALRAANQMADREMAAMRATVGMLSNQVPADAERIQQLGLKLERLDEQRLATEENARREWGQALEDSIKRVDEALAALRGRVTRLERQVQINADEALKTATGLLERIEHARLKPQGAQATEDAVAK